MCWDFTFTEGFMPNVNQGHLKAVLSQKKVWMNSTPWGVKFTHVYTSGARPRW